ncbi:Gag-pol fusion protein [Phytophthora palmivora]|uniref:Gag-pol fusion protein n=1 Tax=Phytophthora palmivora TaxID=4796 RepID=A0A2P4XAW2_9STRA|nr:Gag-pol fusion protein [Phytophthora palmivora]POM62690.1 Gag-pol fusion protein [Phytophthora palmivora]
MNRNNAGRRRSRHDNARARRPRRSNTARRRVKDDTPSDGSSSSSSDSESDDGQYGRTSRRSVSSNSSSDESSSSESSSDNESYGHRENHEQRGYHHLRENRERGLVSGGRRERLRRKSVKDLELPTFTPSPKVPVSTWIDRVDLALKGAAESGRGEWSDKALYFILGNKLMENASKWWVDMDRRTVNVIGEVVKEMKMDAAFRDGDRAKRYVATLRPSLATTRFVRADRERSLQERIIREVQLDGRQTGEGAKTSGDEVSTDTSVATTQDDSVTMTMNMPSDTVVGDGTVGRMIGTTDASTAEEVSDGKSRLKTSDDTTNASAYLTSIGSARMARRKAKKEVKRQQTKMMLIRRQDALRQEEVDRLRAADAIRATRQSVADETIAKLERRRRQCQQDGNDSYATPPTKVMRVNLVKQQRHPTATTSMTEGNLEEFIGADDGLPTAKLTVNDYVEGIGGFFLDVIGVWRFTFYTVFGEELSVDACIVSGCIDDFLLGVDFMKSRGATMDFESNEVRYKEGERTVVIPFRTYDGKGEAKIAAVRMVKMAVLEGNTVTPVEVSVAAKDGERGVFLPTKRTGAVLLAATVTAAHSGRAWVPAINSSSGAVKLPNKKELGTWIPIDEDMQVLSLSGELKTEKVHAWLQKLGDCETPLDDEDEVCIGVDEPDGRELVLKLLRSYRSLTTNTSSCPPATTLSVQHHIDTGDAGPIMMKRRRQAQMEDVIVDDNVAKMLDAGVIEESNGAWGFPVVLVRKKDGEVRFCVDYRALNKITKKDVYPLPRIDETLEALGGALLFTTLDLRAGYWQIKVAPEDRDKTAFTTKRGLYRFVRMPFGLTNAPATFQRLMNGVLRGLTWTTCLVYLDDIVIFTRGGIERHIVELATVLERLSCAGLTLKLKKCKFASKSMEYLGHELGEDGVRPLDRLITAVRDFPRPKDAVEAKRFVHLAGYYRKFVEGFGSMMAPITKLLRKNANWSWSDEQEIAFEQVKAILIKKPLLIYPDFRLPFRVVTDASKIGLGACLMQDKGSGWQPIAFASKVNSEVEGKYGITELECLAVVWSIKLFRPYLYGRQFTIITDHSALKWLMTSPNLTGKLHRWALTLQEFDFDVRYRPGSTNVVADALSRAPVATKVLAAIGRRRRRRRRQENQTPATRNCVAMLETETHDTNEEVRMNDKTMASTAVTSADDSQRTDVDMATTSGGSTVNETVKIVVNEIVDEVARKLTARSGRQHPRKNTEMTTQQNADQDGNMGMKNLAVDLTAVNTDTNQVTTTGPTAAISMPMVTGADMTRLQRGRTRRQGKQSEGSEAVRPLTRAAKRRADEQLRQELAVANVLSRRGEAEQGVEREAIVPRRLKKPTNAMTRPEQLMTGGEITSNNRGHQGPQRIPARRDTTTTGTVETGNPVTSTKMPVATKARPDITIKKTVTWADSVPGEANGATVTKESTRQYEGKKRRGKNADGDSCRRTPHKRAEPTRANVRQRYREDKVGKQQGEREPTLQLTDTEIISAQATSRLVQRMSADGVHRGMEVSKSFGLTVIKTSNGRRIILPPSLWATVFKECHDSVWAGHLRAAHTYARIAQLYW